MIDPVIADLNRYLDEQDKLIEAEERAELELYKERLHLVTKALNSGLDQEQLARRLVSLIENYVEESHEQD
jgi:hypothetical protein